MASLMTTESQVGVAEFFPGNWLTWVGEVGLGGGGVIPVLQSILFVNRCSLQQKPSSARLQ